jgi:protein O-mannosyl-transferase
VLAKRLYLVVGAVAIIVYIGALWNRFALDDNPVVLFNPLLHASGSVWRAFLTSYWPPQVGGGLYRPLTMASYAVDWRIGQVAWFHAMNVAWHAGASVLVAVLVRRWSGDRAALVSGLLFAVHPVHVEAVANIVGRAELMAALFALLAVYAALGCDRVGWSAAALVGGLLSKENAAVVPGLIVWGWMLGLARPSRRRMLGYAASWIAVAAAYAVTRETILNPLSRIENIAPVFVGAAPWAVRLTAVAAFADVARLLVFPLTLRVDYSPAERTLVTSPLDPRFVLGLLCLVALGGLIGLAWRRGRRVEAFGLGWIAIALLPVANLVFPVGVLVAERTLYLPSAGLALAAGAWLADLAPARWRVVAAALVVAGGVRTALRVPVWRDLNTVVLSELEDSPRSYDGPAKMVVLYLNSHQPERALDAFQLATRIYDRTLPWLYVTGAEAAFQVGRTALADSLLARLERACVRCEHYYQYEAGAALARGDTAVADTLLARARKLEAP